LFVDIHRLLPLLRCPLSGASLSLDDGWLRAENGKHRYPIVRGVPVFNPEAAAIKVHPDEHISNALPYEATAIIAASSGPVLNLSAGGTKSKDSKTVECEYSIFRNTDVAADVHSLPFVDNAFDAVVCLNAFEHYRDPRQAAAEVHRVLKEGGTFFMHTAALQPIHEPPHHYFNVTRYGLAEWLSEFSDVELTVSENFNPGYAMAWIAAEVRFGLQTLPAQTAMKDFSNASMKELADLWTRPDTRDKSRLWRAFQSLPAETKEICAAGWQARAVKRPRSASARHKEG
jgi:SAM-dependent methyltransferase